LTENHCIICSRVCPRN